MSKAQEKKPAKGEDEAVDATAEKPKSFLAAKKKLIIIAAAGLLLIGGAGTAAYLFLFSGGETQSADAGADAGHGEAKHEGGHGEAKAEGGHGAESSGEGGHGAPGAPMFFDLPAILVNLRSDDKPVFLKLVVSLEVKDEETVKAVEAILPRVIDQFQTYLRELRVEELSGSAATFRLKEELLRRVKIAASPMEISDVLFKDMIVQ